MSSDKVKLDFKMHSTVSVETACWRQSCAHSKLTAFRVQSAYAENAFLSFGNFTIFSQGGVQQGDPIGPLLFSLTLAEVLNECKSEFTVGNLDGIILGDSLRHGSLLGSPLRDRSVYKTFETPAADLWCFAAV